MKRILSCMLFCLLLCTGCIPTPLPETETIPPPSPLADVPETSGSEAEAETAAEETTASEPLASEAGTEAADETGETDDTQADDETAADNEEKETEAAPSAEQLQWMQAYQSVLRQSYSRSEHEDSYFALIRLNADEIPELVILDGTEMALYCCEEGKAVLLLEDAYKSSAIMEQNVCYQPEKGLFSTAFSMMGGGSGFTIFSYKELDAVSAERFYFDNNENVDGEMPYNPVWDRAEEFEVTDNGYHDVTLGDSWVHIGEDFDAIWELTEEHADAVGSTWGKADAEEEE